ncbi:MAG: sigma-70 family RNA polymerase sigma factor [Myxococcota bacterium]
MATAATYALPSSGRLADDDERFGVVFRAHYPDVLRALRRLTVDDARAEDLAQETFVALGWHRFDPSESHNFRAWLLRTAINRAHNAHRAGKRRRAREANSGLRLVASPEPEADHLDRRRRLCEGLQAIDSRACQLLVLRAMGLEYAELAEVVGVAPSSIGTLLVRAQRSLAKHTHGGQG